MPKREHRGAIPALRSLSSHLRELRFADERSVVERTFAVSAKPSQDKAYVRAGLNALEELNSITGIARDPSALGGLQVPKSVKVVQRVFGKRAKGVSLVAIASTPTFAAKLRASHSSLRVVPVTWLFPQDVPPLGLELARLEVDVPLRAPGRTLHVQVVDSDGNPLSQVRVRALLDMSTGVNVAGTSDASGLVQLRIPTKFEAVELVFATIEHTYWPAFAPGFARALIKTSPLQMKLESVWPDQFSLIESYGGFDAQAGAGVKVGVIDTGIGPHTDLVVSGGLNALSDEEPQDYLDNGVGHGTHVAGVIAGRGAGGMKGLAPSCTLMSYRVCSASGENRFKAKSSDVARALEQAIQDECDLVNISLGSPVEMPEILPLLQAARENGCLVIAAMGNDGHSEARYPARYGDAVGVSALGKEGTFPKLTAQTLREALASHGTEFVPDFSNHGVDTDFIGPGLGVVSTFPGNRYAAMDGTSMAAPFVTGITAKHLSQDRNTRTMARNASRTAAILDLAKSASRMVGFSSVYQGNGLPR